MTETIRVMIADDHPVFRDGLASLLEPLPQIEVVARAGDGAEAVALAAEHHPQRNVILQAMGARPEVVVAIERLELRRGDFLLLCSDGLSVMLQDERMAAAIESAERDPHRAADALVAAANAEGGEDNITVVLFEIIEGDAP